MANETIGKIKCPFTGGWGEVRKDKRGKLYYYSKAGLIKPNLPDGQDWILANAVLFSKKEAEEVNAVESSFGRRIGLSDELVDKVKKTVAKHKQPEQEPAPVPVEESQQGDDSGLLL